jgi:hypothetical protein
VTFTPDDEVLPLIKNAFGEQFLRDLLSQGIPKQTICPADISPEMAKRINQTAVKAFQTMGCRDWCRIDFRWGSDGELYVLELNPIAGIAPGYWLPNSAAIAGLNYAAFINTILDIALARILENQPNHLPTFRQNAWDELISTN